VRAAHVAIETVADHRAALRCDAETFGGEPKDAYVRLHEADFIRDEDLVEGVLEPQDRDLLAMRLGHAVRNHGELAAARAQRHEQFERARPQLQKLAPIAVVGLRATGR
jgi:hypothetical protein